MQTPNVTFVVPCYKLAHLLPDCINSILSQTYRDFEVLIMDDCSPDDTAEVARSFDDQRVTHVRNDPNLGHLRNYNKGIGLARGKYVWLISADDYLRRPYVLERYVRVLESNPEVGYAFCAGVGVRDGRETDTLDYSVRGEHDRVIPGHLWLETILRENVVLAASGLVRRECYETLGAFPLDMPWAGDWYLWCLFALHFDVAYFSEPMVCYREHELSMTTQLTRSKAEDCCQEEIAIPWEIRRKALASGRADVAETCLGAVCETYARNLRPGRFGLPEPVLSMQRFEASLRERARDVQELEWVRSRTYSVAGDVEYWRGAYDSASRLYGAALRSRPWDPVTLTKRILLSLGGAGALARRAMRSLVRGDGRGR
jgi:glycosyltransferase involved in cell wall biosynthesis